MLVVEQGQQQICSAQLDSPKILLSHVAIRHTDGAAGRVIFKFR